jgi:hypothetical protein
VLPQEAAASIWPPFLCCRTGIDLSARGAAALKEPALGLPCPHCPPPPRSVLEPGRTLTLAERGGEGAEVVVGADGFLVLGTMNPGGDFGKKELSPALSNRFTQVWPPHWG